MKTSTIYIFLICYLISFVNTTFADEKSDAEKTVLEIKQILLPRVTTFYRIGSRLTEKQKAAQKKKDEKWRVENRTVEKNKKLLIAMAKTNNYVKEILKNEILNTPLKGMNAEDYGRDCYVYELMNTLKYIDKFELINIIKTIYNSDKWDSSAKSANIRYCQKLRGLNANQNVSIDKELLPLMYKAAQDENNDISTSALQILLGSISEKPPLDKNYGIFLVKEKISKSSNAYDKNFYYRLLREANVDEKEYKKFLREQVANTNAEIVSRIFFEKELNSMGEDVHIARDALKKLVEEGKVKVKGN